MTKTVQEFIEGRFADFMEITLEEYRQGYCRAMFRIHPRYINPLGSVHGGYLYTIADTAAGLAALHMGSRETVATISGNMQYLNAAIGCDRLRAEAIMVKDGKRVTFTEVSKEGEDGTVFARGSFSFARLALPHVATPPVSCR